MSCIQYFSRSLASSIPSFSKHFYSLRFLLTSQFHKNLQVENIRLYKKLSKIFILAKYEEKPFQVKCWNRFSFSVFFFFFCHLLVVCDLQTTVVPTKWQIINFSPVAHILIVSHVFFVSTLMLYISWATHRMAKSEIFV